MAGYGPIIETYKGIKIRKVNTFTLRMSAPFFKFLILESERTKMPISKILAHSSKPCEKCINTSVVVFKENGDEVSIKRGILSRNISQGSGSSIIDQANEKSRRLSKKD